MGLKVATLMQCFSLSLREDVWANVSSSHVVQSLEGHTKYLWRFSFVPLVACRLSMQCAKCHRRCHHRCPRFTTTAISLCCNAPRHVGCCQLKLQVQDRLASPLLICCISHVPLSCGCPRAASVYGIVCIRFRMHSWVHNAVWEHMWT